MSQERYPLPRLALEYHRISAQVLAAQAELHQLRVRRKRVGVEYSIAILAELPPGEAHESEYDGIRYACSPHADGKGIDRRRLAGKGARP